MIWKTMKILKLLDLEWELLTELFTQLEINKYCLFYQKLLNNCLKTKIGDINILQLWLFLKLENIFRMLQILAQLLK